MIGLDDVIFLNSYSATCSCFSPIGTVFEINSQDFFRRMDLQSDIWEEIKTVTLHKKLAYETMIGQNKHMQIESARDPGQKSSANQAQVDLDRAYKIEPFDFFNMMYHGEDIPAPKIDRVLRLRKLLAASSESMEEEPAQEERRDALDDGLSKRPASQLSQSRKGVLKRPDGSMKLDLQPPLQASATSNPILRKRVQLKTASRAILKTVINFDTKNFFDSDGQLKISRVQIAGDQDEREKEKITVRIGA